MLTSSRKTGSSAVLLAIALSATAPSLALSQPKPRPLVDSPVVPVTELLGMRPNEIRARFGLRNMDEARASELIATPDGAVMVLRSRDLLPLSGGCEAGAQPSLRAGEHLAGRLRFRFREGRLVEIRGQDVPVSELELICYPLPPSLAGKPVAQAGVNALTLLWRGAAALEDPGRNEAATTLAKVRLGGGADALRSYANANPDRLTWSVDGRGDEVARLTLRASKPRSMQGGDFAYVTLHQGRVLAISSERDGCVVRNDALRC